MTLYKLQVSQPLLIGIPIKECQSARHLTSCKSAAAFDHDCDSEASETVGRSAPTLCNPNKIPLYSIIHRRNNEAACAFLKVINGKENVPKLSKDQRVEYEDSNAEAKTRPGRGLASHSSTPLCIGRLFLV